MIDLYLSPSPNARGEPLHPSPNKERRHCATLGQHSCQARCNALADANSETTFFRPHSKGG
jgi:hypothetical protein